MTTAARHIPARSEQAYSLYGLQFTSLITGAQSGGSISMMELLVPPNAGAHMHVHINSDEQFYVLDGDVEFQVAETTIHGTTGDCLHIPRGTMHGFHNGPTFAKLLVSFTPADAGVEFEGTGEAVDADPRWTRPESAPTSSS